MIVEIITTGTELLLGEIVNSNAAYLSKQLNSMGFDVLYQTTIGDNRDRMKKCIEYALNRADIVITSGGLGPTNGDLTREVSADIMKQKLVFDEQIAEEIRHRFLHINKEMTDNNLKQAYVPECAVVFHNIVGTAPGLCFENNDAVLINLPGPPREMRPMFEQSVMPYLNKKYHNTSVIKSRILNTYGIGESSLEERIREYIINQTNPTLALLVRPYGVIVRITAKAENETAAIAMIDDMEEKLRRLIDKYIYAVDNKIMESSVAKLLRDAKLTLSCCESCTGGLLTDRLTDISGSSVFLKGSIIAYSDEIKQREVGVKKDTLYKYGAVSAETAAEMALNIKNKYDTDIGVGITGFAEPKTSLSSGLVFICISGRYGDIISKNVFTGSRLEIKYRASQEALDMIRHYVKQYM